MNCPHCGAPAPENARFCQECGGALQVVCPQCGQPAAAGSRFCANCGGRLGAPESGGGEVKSDAKSALAGAFPPPPPPPTTGQAAPPAGYPPAAPQNLPPVPQRTMTAPPPPPAAAAAPAWQAPPPPPASAAPAAWQPAAPAWGVAPGVAPAAYEFKGLGPRLLAKLIDGALLGLVGAALSMLVIGDASSVDPTLFSAVSWLYGLLSLAYSVLLEAGGGTLGKRILKMRVVAAEDGGKPGFKRALIRNLMHLVDSLPVLYLVGMLTMASSDKKQRLGDRAAGTYVVKA